MIIIFIYLLIFLFCVYFHITFLSILIDLKKKAFEETSKNTTNYTPNKKNKTKK